MTENTLISIRVTVPEKTDIKALAVKHNMTVTDYIKQKALYDVNSDSPSDSNTEQKEKEFDVLLTQIEVKDKELAEKNTQIKDLHKLLDQQQQLHLASNQKEKELQKHLEIETEKNNKKWYQIWKD